MSSKRTTTTRRRRLSAAAAVLLLGADPSSRPTPASAFQRGVPRAPSRRRLYDAAPRAATAPVAPPQGKDTPRIQSPSSSSSSSSSSPSVASKWMENEKQLEEDLERQRADAAAAAPRPGTPASGSGGDGGAEETAAATASTAAPYGLGRWEELHGNHVLRPSDQRPPRALLHFLGGALVGAAPHLTYRYLLERLASQGYLVVATPYSLSFDHLATCDDVIGKFERVAPELAREYGAVPVVGVGHSCGSLLHVLITSLFPDTPRAANALLSYNNREVGEAVPFFDDLVVPLFGDKERNGSGPMRAALEVAREGCEGKVPSDEALLTLVQSLAAPLPASLTDAILTPSLVSVPAPLRRALDDLLAGPARAALSSTDLPALLLGSLDVAEQVPDLVDEVEAGARDFAPPPAAVSSAARRAYRCRRTLLVQFEDDPLDDSEQLEGYLREAESVMKTKRPMITVGLKRRVLGGSHLTPLLGPSGGEGWGAALEGALGGVLEAVNGGGGGGESGGEEAPTAEDASSQENSKSAKAVREALGYEQVEKVVDELVAWLDEGSL